MANDNIALVVGASPEEFAFIGKCLSDWQSMSAPLRDEETGITTFAATADPITGYARDTEENTAAICEPLRNMEGASATPIVLAVGRHDIAQAYPIRRIENSQSIIFPLAEDRLRAKLAELPQRQGVSQFRRSQWQGDEAIIVETPTTGAQTLPCVSARCAAGW